MSMSLFIYLGLVFIIDFEYKVILNSLIISGLVLGTIIGIYRNGLVTTLLGGAVGLCVLLVLFYTGKLVMPYLAQLRQIQLEKQALYRNDVILGLILGLILGWSVIIKSLLIAFVLAGFAGILISLYMIFQCKYDPNLSMPMGPFLVLGVIFVYLIY